MGKLKNFFPKPSWSDAVLVLLIGIALAVVYMRGDEACSIPVTTPPSPSSIPPSMTDTLPAVAERRSHAPTPRDSIVRCEGYVGPPAREVPATRRIPRGETLDLNTADSATLTLVPGIGPTFARRIVHYRRQLGGYYTVLQLQEVWGMTAERFRQVAPYFVCPRAPQRAAFSSFAYDSIPRHPYLSYKQRNAISRILYRDGRLEGGFQRLATTELFDHDDSVRLSHYFLFE